MDELVERREDHREWRLKMEKQIEDNTAMTQLNTEITEDTKKKVDDVYDILVHARMAFKLFGWIATGAKWLGIVASCVTAVAGAIGIVYYMFKHGGDLPGR